MKRDSRQSVIYLLLVLLLSVCFFRMMFAGQLTFLSHKAHEITMDILRQGAKDFDVDEDVFVSNSKDPWLDVEIPRGRYREITLDVYSMNKSSTRCTVYYCLSENDNYSDERSVTVALKQGRVSIPLPEEEIDRIRLDLTSSKSVSIGLKKVCLIEANSDISGRTILLVSGVLVLILLALIPVSALLAKLCTASNGSIIRMIQEKPKLLLALLMTISIVICFGRYMFGSRYFAFLDIGSDTVYDYQTKWFSMADDFHTGHVAQWTLNNGLGASVLAQASWLLDPFLWPTLLAYLLSGFPAAQISVAWMQGLKLLICALLCYDFLSEFSLKNMAKVVSSYAYGFCGYVMLWGQHYMFSTYFLISTLILLFLERAIKQERIGKQHLYLVLSVAWLAAKTYYFSYMSLLSMAVYVVFRLFFVYQLRDVKAWASAGMRVLLSVLLGFILASVFLLPQVYEVMTTSDRITNGGDLLRYFNLTTGEHLKTLLSRVLSNNLFGTQTFSGYKNYYEAEQLFFSSFMPLFFVLYVTLGLQKNLKTFVCRLTGVFALCLLVLTPVAGYVLNAFVAPSERYTYVLMPIYAYIAAKVIEAIIDRKVTLFQLALAIVPYFLIFLNIYEWGGFIKSRGMVVAAYVFCGVVLIGTYRLFPRGAKVVRVLLAIVILVNVLTDAWLTTNDRTTLDDLFSESKRARMTATVKRINSELAEADPELYRVEKTYTDYSFWNDAMIEDYYGVSYYNSTINYGVKDFFRNCWYAAIYFADGIYIQFERDFGNTQMAGLLGVKYLISENKDLDVPSYRFFKKMHGKYVYENSDYRGFGRFYTGTMTVDEYLAHPEEERSALLQDYIILDRSQAPTAANGTVIASRPTKEDHIEVTVNADEDGYVFLPIAYDQGWRVTVNGAPQEILKADYGFMAVPVNAGTCELKLDYQIPMLKQGALISALGVVIVVIMIAIKRRLGIVPLHRGKYMSEKEARGT